MAAPRFLNLVNGRIRQFVAILTSAGAADGEKIVATGTNGKIDDTILGAATTGNSIVVKTKPDGTIDESILPTGIGADVKMVVASEALAANDLVNIWSDAGVEKVRKADATVEGKEVSGFVLSSATSNSQAAVYFEGRISGLTGLTPGARQYLATVAGQSTATAPSASGNVVQLIGSAVSPTEIDFEKSNPITVA